MNKLNLSHTVDLTVGNRTHRNYTAAPGGCRRHVRVRVNERHVQ